MISILHLSDLHFESPIPVIYEDQLSEALLAVIEKAKEPIYLLISGDITFMGNPDGFRKAIIFFKELKKKSSKINNTRILVCPGNHDIHLSKFDLFDSFSYSLRLNKDCTYKDNNCVLIDNKDGILFLGLNSVYKRDYKYGFIDIRKIKSLMDNIDLSKFKTKFCFLHHHLINQFEKDVSVLRNAYNLIELLDHYQFNYILHGHQHSNQILPIGRSKMLIIGVRSTNFNDVKGYSTGINLYLVDERSFTVNNFIYQKYGLVDGIFGNFIPLINKIIKR